MNTSDYNQYVQLCHAANAGDKTALTTEILDVPDSYPIWTSKGVAGNFQWRSLGTVFSPHIHLIKRKQQELNDFFRGLISQSGLHMMSHLVQSMSADSDYQHLVNDGNTLIANSDILYTTGYEWEADRAIGMREYLRQNTTMNDDDCFLLENGNILNFYTDNIKEQNILIPLPVLMKSRLEMFVTVADRLCRAGAKTVYGVFLAYSVPGADGKEYPEYPAIPEIKGISFDDLTEMY